MKQPEKINSIEIISVLLTLALSINILHAQLRIEDISPKIGATDIKISAAYQSVSGKALTIAVFGSRVYLGGESGVWRSDDGGETWRQPVQPQPPAGSFQVNGALLCPNVYDLLISKPHANTILAATGNDARVPSKAGIYRSTDGGNNWTLVHQFISQSSTGITGRMIQAPDNPNKIYAAGQFAIAKSEDEGNTWTEVRPQGTSGLNVWTVAVGPQQGTQRKIYAVGSRVWYSLDDGETWNEDPAARSLNISLGGPSNAAGASIRTLAINPINSNIIYLNMNGNIWRGDFTSVLTAGRASWRQLPSTPTGYEGTTASGTDYIATHVTTNDGLLYLFASDRRTTHISIGEPTAQTSWKRIDQPNVHLDPHGMDVSFDFRYFGSGPGGSPGFGRTAMVCDGGIYFSTDGTKTWQHGKGLTTLGLVNATVMPHPGGQPAICIGMGDNSGFSTRDGGATWKTQDYVGGDNDACFSDPFQPNKLYVFAPRSGGKGVYLYTAPIGQTPDGSYGTSQRKSIPGPPLLPGNERGWNVVSSHFNLGYRPLVYTLPGQRPRPEGDFIAVRYTTTKALLLRTTKLGSVTSMNDWVTSATEESSGAKVFQQGPDLPVVGVNVVQASGGHDAPVFYIGDLGGAQRVWKWAKGMAGWEQIVPGAAGGADNPQAAIRFFVDPYLPHIIYVLDRNGIYFSDNYGNTWRRDTKFEEAITENGAFPFVIPSDGNPGEALVRDIIFDPSNHGYRFAVGPAGVFYTVDGINWDHFLLTSAMPMRPNNLSYNPCERALYVATNNRGLLRLSPLPPDWEGPIGGLYGVEGFITLLRVHDVGTKYGPPSDQLDDEVIIKLDSRGDEAFGFQLRKDNNEKARKGMLEILRSAYQNNKRIRIDYKRQGCNTGEIIRVWIP
jgi:photosystem II stability/assembly factor-like uncharacterized protein